MSISFLEILLRLSVAAILGAVIRLERESTEHGAGLRTQALVALGSSLFTIISAFGFVSFLGAPHMVYDTCTHASVTIESLKVHAEQELDTIEVICHIPDTATLAQVIDKLRALPEVHAVHTYLHGSANKNLMP